MEDFKPTRMSHGLAVAGGPHAGDMSNLAVRPNGAAKARLFLSRVSLGEGADSILRPGGTALVIHAGRDDQASDPSGGAGSRLA